MVGSPEMQQQKWGGGIFTLAAGEGGRKIVFFSECGGKSKNEKKKSEIFTLATAGGRGIPQNFFSECGGQSKQYKKIGGIFTNGHWGAAKRYTSVFTFSLGKQWSEVGVFR